MRVKIGKTWYDADNHPIAIELNESDKQNIANMSPEASLYAEASQDHFENDKAFSDWMRQGTNKENSDIPVIVERIG